MCIVLVGHRLMGRSHDDWWLVITKTIYHSSISGHSEVTGDMHWFRTKQSHVSVCISDCYNRALHLSLNINIQVQTTAAGPATNLHSNLVHVAIAFIFVLKAPQC